MLLLHEACKDGLCSRHASSVADICALTTQYTSLVNALLQSDLSVGRLMR